MRALFAQPGICKYPIPNSEKKYVFTRESSFTENKIVEITEKTYKNSRLIKYCVIDRKRLNSTK